MANVKVPPFTEAPSGVVGGTPQTVFPFEFPFWAAADILFYIDGALLSSANYTVEGFRVQGETAVEGGYGSGEITLDTAISNCTWTIDRLVVGDRQTQFSRSVPLGMPALNGDLNRLTARQQDLERRKITAPAGRAGLFLAFDADGVPIASPGSTPDGVAVSTFGEDFVGAADERAARLVLGVEENNTYSLLNVLTSAERADVLAGTNAIDITAKWAALIASVPEGATVDATMLRGDVLLTSTLFTSPYRTPIVLRTGPVTLKKDFTDGPLLLPSGLRWEMARTNFARAVETTDILSDASPAKAMLQTFTDSGLSSGTSGGTTVAVQYPSTIQIGGMLAIEGIVEATEIVLALAAAITTTSQTDVTLVNTVDAAHANGITTDTIGSSVVILKVGSEIMKGSVNASTGAVTISQRGALGTTAATHLNGAAVTLMKAFVAKITALAGSVVTIDETLPRTFTDARYRVGTLGTQIVGDWTIDGGYDGHTITDVWGCLSATLATNFVAQGGRLKNAPHAGIFLFHCIGARCDITDITDCGRPGDSLGSAVWVFGGGSDNRVSVDFIHGGFIGLAIDNKSYGVSGYGLMDSPSNCYVNIGTISGATASVNISACSDNFVSIGRSDAPAPVIDKGDSQVVTPITASGNVIRIDRQDGLTLYPNGNAIADNTVSVNGHVEREIRGSTTTGAIIYVAYQSQPITEYTFTVTGLEVGDRCEPHFSVPLPQAVSAYVVCETADTANVVFPNGSNDTREIPAGTVISIVGRGAW